LHICALVDLNQTPEPCHLYILIHPIEQPIPAEVPKNILYLALPSGKRGQMVFLHNTLPQASRFIRSALHKDPNTQIWIACEDGKDASVGVALCALQGFFDDSGNYLGEGNNDGRPYYSL
jgi:tRNA A64-2'-O-ribosylphosphate transferase